MKFDPVTHLPILDPVDTSQPDSVDPNVTPGSIPGINAPVTSPDQLPPVMDEAGNTRQGADVFKASVSNKGLTQDGLNLVKTGIQNPLDKRIAAQEAPIDAAAKQHQAETSADYAHIKQGLDAQAAATTDYWDHQTTILAQQSALNEEYAKQEQQAYATSKMENAQYMNAYQSQLAAVRQMAVDPTGPIGKLSTAQAGGLSLAMFAQGFLAARGININVGQQIDQWVDRSIHEQERQISQAQQGAQDTLNLWQIARQNSKDDFEARQRFRGYAIEGIKASVEMNAARFNSSLATSKATESNARLDLESHNTAWAIQQQDFKDRIDNRKNEYEHAYQMGMLGLENAKVKKAELASKTKDANAKVPTIISDPTTHTNKWFIAPNEIGAEQKALKAQEAKVNFQQINTDINDAINERQNFSGDYGHGSAIDNFDEAKRRYGVMVDRLAAKLAKATFGTRTSDQEGERVKKWVPFDKWYQGGSNANIWLDARKEIRQDFDAEMQGLAHAIPKDQQTDESTNDAAPGQKTTEDVRNGTVLDTEVNKTADEVESKDSGELGKASGFFTKHGETPTDASHSSLERITQPDMQPGHTIALDHLAEMAIDPATYSSSPYQADKAETEKIKADVLETLKRFANKASRSEDKRYAQKLLDGIQNDPEGTLALLRERPGQ